MKFNYFWITISHTHFFHTHCIHSVCSYFALEKKSLGKNTGLRIVAVHAWQTVHYYIEYIQYTKPLSKVQKDQEKQGIRIFF